MGSHIFDGKPLQGEKHGGWRNLGESEVTDCTREITRLGEGRVNVLLREQYVGRGGWEEIVNLSITGQTFLSVKWGGFIPRGCEQSLGGALRQTVDCLQGGKKRNWGDCWGCQGYGFMVFKNLGGRLMERGGSALIHVKVACLIK